MAQGTPPHSGQNHPQGPDQPTDRASLIGELKLRLRRIRSQATAARLEARAAELELLLHRATADPPQAGEDATRTGETQAAPPDTRIQNWDSLAAAARRRQQHGQPTATGAVEPPSAERNLRADDAPTTIPKRTPHRAPKRTPKRTPKRPAKQLPRLALAIDDQFAKAGPGGQRKNPGQRPNHERRGGRKKPAAWIVSTAVHAALLLILAAFSLSVHAPQDQVALTATAATASEPESLQTLKLESLADPVENDSPEPTETPTELDPLVAMPIPPPVALADLLSDITPAASDPASELLEHHERMTALSDDSQITTKFCGVEGGGNHFVYLVDSSQSMKNGRFESARRELLQSIDALQPQQRFYIIFYDSHVDRMCVTDPTEPDEFSLLATVEHKRKARRWAMSVALERGAPPDTALSFALKLRPDVIFLLSDGEFPQRIEDLMAEQNRTSNLFGDAGPISILHTIGYHSRDGETRMRRLANANGGQYRYIPGP